MKVPQTTLLILEPLQLKMDLLNLLLFLQYFLKFSPDLCSINLDSITESNSIFLKPFDFKVLIILL